MKIGVAVFGVSLDPSADLREVSSDDTIAPYLTRKTTLPTDPLAVYVKIAFKPGTVTLDTRLRPNDNRGRCHQYVPPWIGSRPIATWAAP